MHNKLLEIIEKKKEDLIQQKNQVSLEELKEKCHLGEERREISHVVRDDNTFIKNISQAKNVALIAEIKFASPTNPHLGSKEELLQRVKAYEKAGADAISIITEPHFFNGDLAFVSQVKKYVSLPVLQKDFVIDEYQIYQAKEIGADALLLIARIVDDTKLKKFVLLCQELGIEPVVEIHNEEDLQKATNTATKIIAVNARDLDTLIIDLAHARKILQQIPDDFIKLGFSGILEKEDAIGYKDVGANGILIGTALMKTRPAEEIFKFINELKTI